MSISNDADNFNEPELKDTKIQILKNRAEQSAN